jgi:hypothetical protein
MGTSFSTLRRRKARLPILPVELLVLIEEFLVGANCFRTAANLNETSRQVHQETLPALYTVAVWPYDHFLDLTGRPFDLMYSMYRRYVK